MYISKYLFVFDQRLVRITEDFLKFQKDIRKEKMFVNYALEKQQISFRGQISFGILKVIATSLKFPQFERLTSQQQFSGEYVF